MRPVPKWHIITIPILAIAGCAPDYSKSAASIASGVSDIKSASQSITQSETDSRQQFLVARGIVHHRALQATPECNGKGDPHECFMIDPVEARTEKALADRVNNPDYIPTVKQAIQDTFPGASPIEVVKKIAVPEACLSQAMQHLDVKPQAEKESLAPSEGTIVKALDDYAQALAAVTKKSDEDDYKTAAGKLATSVGTLASTLGAAAGGAGAAIGPVATAIVKIASDAYLAILKQQRYDALKTAVLAACIPVHNLAYAEAIILRYRNNVDERDLQYVANVDIEEKNLTSADLKQLAPMQMQAAAKLRAGTTADAGAPAMKLLKSHNELVTAVLSGKGESAALIQTIGDFAGDAKELKDASQTKVAAGASAKK